MAATAQVELRLLLEGEPIVVSQAAVAIHTSSEQRVLRRAAEARGTRAVSPQQRGWLDLDIQPPGSRRPGLEPREMPKPMCPVERIVVPGRWLERDHGLATANALIHPQAEVGHSRWVDMHREARTVEVAET